MLFLIVFKKIIFSLGETKINLPPSYSMTIRSKESAGLDFHDLENPILEMDRVGIFHLNGPLLIHRFPSMVIC
jgi:hypothetical protein